MHNIRKCIALVMGFSTPALSTATPVTFNGFYLGGNFGAAKGVSNYETSPGCVPSTEGGVFCNTSPAPSVINGAAVSSTGSGKMVSREVTGGIQAGYNWQRDSFIFGGEADFNTLKLNKTFRADGVFPFAFLGTRYTLTESISSDWLVTVRGRLGFTLYPQLLLYATGGGAFTQYTFASSYRDNAVDLGFPGGSGYGNNTSSKTGWTVGGGGEWRLTEHLSVKAEYLYVDFGSMNVWVPLSNTSAFRQTMLVKNDFNTNIVRFGLNYQFA